MKTENNKRKHKIRSLVAELGVPTGGLLHYFGLKEKISDEHYKLLSTSFISLSLFIGTLSGTVKNQTVYNTMSNENFHYEEIHEKRLFLPYPISFVSNKVAERISPSKERQRLFVTNKNNTFCEYDLEQKLESFTLSKEQLDSFPIVPNRVMTKHERVITSNNEEFRTISNTCYNTLKEKIEENNKLYEGFEKNPFHKNSRLAIR